MIISTIILRTSDFDYFKQKEQLFDGCSGNQDVSKSVNHDVESQKFVKKQKKINKAKTINSKMNEKKDHSKSNFARQTQEIKIIKDDSTRSLFATQLIGSFRINQNQERIPIYTNIFESFEFPLMLEMNETKKENTM